jgi:tetratricopeptide (TPR) repeat protein
MAFVMAFLAGGNPSPELVSAGSPIPASHATFNRDIAPIIYQNCASCHRPGESGPFPPRLFRRALHLGIALASSNDMTAAVEQFREAARLDPSDAGAQASLGMALAELGQLAEAKSYLEQALQLDPENAMFKERLQAVEQMIASH